MLHVICIYFLYLQITASNPAVLYIGARIPRHFRFSGEIVNVVVFPNDLFSPDTVLNIHNEFANLLSPTGTCVEYLQEGDDCPEPTSPPSLLCSSVYGQ